jgi:hypothetical protein
MTSSQTTFVEALLAPDLPVPDGLVDPAGLPAGKRFDVYRNNVAVSLADALETAFPVLAKLLGAANFRSLAGLFLRAHPPRTPLMMHYGADMPGFLEAFEPLAHLGYLPDIARLELGLRRSYHAADATGIDPALLESTPPDRLMAATLKIAPAVIVLRSRWPIHAIWQFNTAEGAPKPQMQAEDVLITRPEFDPDVTRLGPGAAAFINALQSGAPFAQALDTAQAEAPTFDLTHTLGLLLAGQAITELDDSQ